MATRTASCCRSRSDTTTTTTQGRNGSLAANGEHAVEKCGSKRLGGGLASKMSKGEWGADSFEIPQVTVNHRRLAKTKPKNSIIGLSPFLLE